MEAHLIMKTYFAHFSPSRRSNKVMLFTCETMLCDPFHLEQFSNDCRK